MQIIISSVNVYCKVNNKTFYFLTFWNNVFKNILQNWESIEILKNSDGT